MENEFYIFPKHRRFDIAPGCHYKNDIMVFDSMDYCQTIEGAAIGIVLRFLVLYCTNNDCTLLTMYTVGIMFV